MITFNVTFSSSNVQMDTNFGTLQRLTKKGLDGLSAYEVAVKNGFVGSEEEWLESLIGPAVTVESVQESPEDNGANVITFSDGSQMTVRNGSKGERGDTGIVAPTNGFFTLAVEPDGNLYAYVEEDSELDFEYDDATGSLYIVQEVE